MRPAHPLPHARQLLPLTRPVLRHLAKRIPAHRELRIKTRLHELRHRLRQQIIVRSREHPAHERRARFLAHPARHTTLTFPQRPRQPALPHERPQSPAHRRSLRHRQLRAPILREKTPQHRRHQSGKFRRRRVIVHRPHVARSPPPSQHPPAFRSPPRERRDSHPRGAHFDQGGCRSRRSRGPPRERRDSHQPPHTDPLARNPS